MNIPYKAKHNNTEIYVGNFPKFNPILKKQFTVLLTKYVEVNNSFIEDDFFDADIDELSAAIFNGNQKVCLVTKDNTLLGFAVFYVGRTPFIKGKTFVLNCNIIYTEDTEATDVIFFGLAEYAKINDIVRVCLTTPRKGFLRRFDSSSKDNYTLYRIMYNDSYYNTEEYLNYSQMYIKE